MPRRRHFGVASTYKARKVPVRTRRPKMTQEEKRAKARAYYHAHKAHILEQAKRRRRDSNPAINRYGGSKGRKRAYGVKGGRIGPNAPYLKAPRKRLKRIVQGLGFMGR